MLKQEIPACVWDLPVQLLIFNMFMTCETFAYKQQMFIGHVKLVSEINEYKCNVKLKSLCNMKCALIKTPGTFSFEWFT